MKNKIFNKPNQLINLIPETNITITERKTYNIMLKYAQNKLKFHQYQGNTFKISCYTLHKKANLRNDDNEYIYKKLENLMKTVVRIFREKNNKKEWKKSFTLLSSIEKTDDNCYKFELNNHIITALKNQKFFTPLDLMIINSLSSQYSIIFYELAIQYQKYKIPKMTIEEIRRLTNTKDSYKQFYDFRKRVLDKACEEISKKTDIILRYSTEKRGRRIAFVDFEIEKKEIIPAVTKNKLKKVRSYSKEVLELFELLPEKEQIEAYKGKLERLLGKHSLEYLKADIEYAKQVKPANFLGFLTSSCNQGHYATIELEKKRRKEELARKQVEEDKRRKEREEKLDRIAHQKAVEKYERLSKKELSEYSSVYSAFPNLLKEKVSERDFVINALKEQIKSLV